MIKVRVEGKLKDIEFYIKQLKKDKKFEVLEVSKPYKNRGASELYRVYVTILVN
jgi:hypothetical protein